MKFLALKHNNCTELVATKKMVDKVGVYLNGSPQYFVTTADSYYHSTSPLVLDEDDNNLKCISNLKLYLKSKGTVSVLYKILGLLTYNAGFLEYKQTEQPETATLNYYYGCIIIRNSVIKNVMKDYRSSIGKEVPFLDEESYYNCYYGAYISKYNHVNDRGTYALDSTTPLAYSLTGNHWNTINNSYVSWGTVLADLEDQFTTADLDGLGRTNYVFYDDGSFATVFHLRYTKNGIAYSGYAIYLSPAINKKKRDATGKLVDDINYVYGASGLLKDDSYNAEIVSNYLHNNMGKTVDMQCGPLLSGKTITQPSKSIIFDPFSSKYYCIYKVDSLHFKLYSYTTSGTPPTDISQWTIVQDLTPPVASGYIRLENWTNFISFNVVRPVV